uniref:Uncharacterized protein n=1 Tax=Anguilla anguilla TaxID=7936 RepID=A0A0E9X7G6_ANGAN
MTQFSNLSCHPATQLFNQITLLSSFIMVSSELMVTVHQSKTNFNALLTVCAVSFFLKS